MPSRVLQKKYFPIRIPLVRVKFHSLYRVFTEISLGLFLLFTFIFIVLTNGNPLNSLDMGFHPGSDIFEV